MKRLMSIMLGMSLVLGAATVSFAQPTTDTTKTKKTTKKKTKTTTSTTKSTS